MKTRLLTLVLVLGLALAMERAAAVQPPLLQDLSGEGVISDPFIVPSHAAADDPTAKSWDPAFPFSAPLAPTGDRWPPDVAFHPQEQSGSPEAPNAPDAPEQLWMKSPDAGCPPGASCGLAEPGRPWQRSPESDWFMPEGAPPLTEAAGMAPQSTGGPDDFGYRWDDSILLNWIDASRGTDTGINSSTDHVGPIDLGFSFKYYENTYTRIYISRFGFVAFNDNNIVNSQSRIPSPEKPDDVIAPHWVPAYDVNGYVRYLRGGSAPNRWLAVEWNRLSSDCCNDAAEEYTFEVIIHENGDVVFQYGTMIVNGGYWCQASGIEDSTGLDGLSITAFCNRIAPNHAVRIYRPIPSARVRVYPLYQGSLTRAGETVVFRLPIRNTGELGADTYDLTTASPWPIALYAADGTTPLTDTDGDGKVDTGSMPQGGAVTIVAKVQTPGAVNLGNANAASVVVRSSRDAGKSKTATLQTAVPAPFAQVYRDNADGAMSLYLAQPAGQVARKTTADSYYGYNMAVAETPAGNFVYAWNKGRSVSNVYVREIEYALLNRYGETIRPVARLTDHSAATVSTYDYPAVTVAPNGRIGVLWSRYLWNDSTSQFNYNVYFAVLDAAGNVVVPPINLTNNAAWGTSSDLNVPGFYYPRIVATGDNRFVLVWLQEHRESAGYVDDIFYAVRDSNGGEVRGVSRMTADTPGWNEGYYYPGLAALNGNRALLAWARNSDGDIYYAILDSGGNITKSATNLVGDGTSWWDRRPDVVQLSNGKTVVAWTGGSRIRFAVLDAAYNRIAGPTALDAPAALTGSDYVSIAADAGGRAILTWMDADWDYRPNLHYALVDGAGSVLTPPMIFRTSGATSPYIQTSYEGYGNTSYSWTPPVGVDGYVTATSPISGTIGGYATVPIAYGNVGGQPATGVRLEATLGTGLTYASDTSGVTPTVTGNRVRWSLPDMAWISRGEFRLYLQVAAGTAVGARLPVNLTLTSSGSEANPSDNSASVEVIAGLPPGGPDDFGYGWDDNVPFNWVDAKSSGTNSGLYGGDVYTGTVEVGFAFPFYENNYDRLYFSTKGLISFGRGGSWFSNVPIPTPSTPNNIIVAFWDDLGMYRGNRPDAGIYTYQGGTAPNRYFVVEWYRGDTYFGEGTSGNGNSDLTFEVVLHETGDVVMQYLNLSGNLQGATVGIEDNVGLTGLQYLYNAAGLANGKAVRFYRPGPAARVKVYPPYQGQFTHAGAQTAFQVPVVNTGELGADTYDLSLASAWPATLYAADGVTPLSDSDHDGTPDTGAIAAGSTTIVIVKVQTPPGAAVGANNAARLTARSSLNTAKSKTVTLQSAVPASFAQVYRDDADGAMSLYLAQPAGQVARKTTADSYYGYNMAVAETPAGNFVYAWNKGRSISNVYVREIEYALLNRYGETIRPIARLTDHSTATVSTYDYPAVAVAPNGRIGVLWYRYLWNNSTSQSNYNVYFAVLDTAGSVVVAPTNLTNNNLWGTSSDLNVPRFYQPRIIATGDNRFVLAWYRYHRESAGYVYDIYYAVRDSTGNEIRGITKLTNDIPDSTEGYYYPNLAALSGNRALLTWYRNSDRDIYYAVLNSDGAVIKDPANLVGDGQGQEDYQPDAVQLADGKVVVAWTSWRSNPYPNYRIRFAVLDPSYNRIAGPTALDAPAALTGSDYVSVAADAGGRAILTWMDADWNYRPNLYYALVDGAGNVLTPPMIFRTSRATSPYILTSSGGYGNTSYSWTPPAGVDGVVAFGAATFNGPPGGNARLSLRYANRGAATATAVTLSAVLGANLAYVSDTSGVAPTVSGQNVTWHLPDLGLLESRTFWLMVRLPASAPIGASYPVALTLTSAGPEVNSGDNTASAEVIAARQFFLPLTLKR